MAQDLSSPLTPAELVDHLLPLVRDKTGVEIAALVGADPATISRWKKGERPDYMKPGKREKLRRAVELLEGKAGTRARRTSAVREQGPGYSAAPDRLAIALGALEVIRDAADAAIRRVSDKMTEREGE